ncbi:Nitrogen regulation protein NR(I) [Acidisarcina polymorpha]|uniref:Nitrogen regulation protein NR(I) n=1 Tax=Acidisarcina polymorpha TaxID=2211140 RepID=A0A2Z5GAU4_9BACT|nr:Nitrogen regulation protein NR(I) [Acidisarcina polymorpha]
MEAVCFDSTREFLECSREEEASCLILNLCHRNEEGFQLQCRLAEEAYPPVIFTCYHGDVPSVVRALKCGPVELLASPISPADLEDAILSALSRDRTQRRQRAEREDLQRRYSILTPREREVLPLIVGGLLNKQAASVLGISEVTLQIHRSQVVRKMQAHSIADLVRMAASLQIPFWTENDTTSETLPQRCPFATPHHRPVRSRHWRR